MDKLTEIMLNKRAELAPRLRPMSETTLAALHARLPKPQSFAQALSRPDGKLAVIAEIKRRSPSAGMIAASTLEAPLQAAAYKAAGADALSILTDEKYFGGTLADLSAVSEALGQEPPPRLRKDFMIHPLQIAEAREAGASAILIIVRALDDAEIAQLYSGAAAAGLEALFEIHHESELERALRHGARIIGVNNRDLAIFKTDLSLSERLIPQFPAGIIAVSESGIFTPADAEQVRRAGAKAVLVGEALMKAADPARLIQKFRGTIT